MTTCHNRLRYAILNVTSERTKDGISHHHAAGIEQLIHVVTAFLSEI